MKSFIKKLMRTVNTQVSEETIPKVVPRVGTRRPRIVSTRTLDSSDPDFEKKKANLQAKGYKFDPGLKAWVKAGF